MVGNVVPQGARRFVLIDQRGIVRFFVLYLLAQHFVAQFKLRPLGHSAHRKVKRNVAGYAEKYRAYAGNICAVRIRRIEYPHAHHNLRDGEYGKQNKFAPGKPVRRAIYYQR